MLQSIDESFIVKHAFIVSFFFFFHLLHKEVFLDKWIIQFSVGIAELMIFDEEFKSFSKSWFGTMVFC